MYEQSLTLKKVSEVQGP